MAGIATSGFLVDRFGRRTIAAVGYGIAVPWSLAMLPLIQTGDPVFFGVAVLVTYAIVGLVSSPLTALIRLSSRYATATPGRRWPTTSVQSWAARCRR
ncbi:MAG: hypothetical protein WCP30_17060 [Mycobacteriaceae bacterium]